MFAVGEEAGAADTGEQIEGRVAVAPSGGWALIEDEAALMRAELGGRREARGTGSQDHRVESMHLEPASSHGIIGA